MLSACSPNADPVARYGEAASSVINGSLDASNAFSAVGFVGRDMLNHPNLGCSAVLVGPRVALTSAHCDADFTTGCVPFTSGALSVRFAEPNGTFSIGNAANRIVPVQAIIVHPFAAPDVPSCSAAAGDALHCGALQQDTIRRSDELVVLQLAGDPPADVTPARVLVHPGFEHVSPTFAAFDELVGWGTVFQPLVTFVGLGKGSNPWGLQGTRGRDFGVTRWVDLTNSYGGVLGWSDCNNRAPSEQRPGVVVAPDDIFDSDAPNPGAPNPWLNFPDGAEVDGASQSHVGAGDSGGPVLAGIGPASRGIVPTQLPPPEAADSYDAFEQYVIGIASANVPSIGGRPTSVYNPTYTVAASGFLSVALTGEFPLCNDAGPDDDGDGIPNACDECPCDCNPATDPTCVPDNDVDRDGYCASPCSNQVLDNCQFVQNNVHRNCNELSEVAQGATVLGDRCDPAVCPQADLRVERRNDQRYFCPFQGPHPFQTCGPPPPGVQTWLQCADYVETEHHLRPLASHAQDGSFVVPNGLPATSARFCQRDTTLGFDCDDFTIDIQDARLNENGTVTTWQAETITTRFHRVSFVPPSGPAIPTQGLPPSNPNGVGTTLYLFEGDDLSPTGFSWVWDHEADHTRWINAGLINPTTAGPAGLHGNFWLHTDTPLGGTIDIGSGTHDNNPQLNNFYQNGPTLNAPNDSYWPERFYCYACGILEVGPIPLSNLEAGEVGGGVRHLVWRPLPVQNKTRLLSPAVELHEALVILPMGDEWGFPDGGCGGADVVDEGIVADGQFVTNRLGAALLSRLNDPSQIFVNSVEPDLSMGRGPAFPSTVMMSETGDQIVDFVVTTEDELLAAEDLELIPPEQTGSPNATGFEAILTRTLGGVFVIGGDHPSTGQPTGEMWFTSLDDFTWFPFIADGYRPHHVLAATYAYKNNSLWILDETSGGQARLVSIDVRDRTVTTIGEFQRHSKWYRHYLVVDRDGGVLLASSTARRHRIARIEEDEQPRGISVIDDEGELLAKPTVDPARYGFLVNRGKSTSRIRFLRKRELRLRRRATRALAAQL